MKYMLDTNIIIYLIKNKYQNVFTNFARHKIDGVCISSVVLGELLYGAEKSNMKTQSKKALYSMLSGIKVLDFTAKAAEKYGQIRADLEEQGQIIGPMDMLIAGHALAEGLILVTNNTREFGRVKGLSVENWV